MSRTARWAIVLIVVFVIVAMGITLLAFWGLGGGRSSHRGWHSAKVVSFDLSGAIPELKPNDPFTRWANPNMVDFKDMLDALEKARTDSSIEGIYLDVDSPGLGWAQNEELRAAIDEFEASGKWCIAYMETAGEFSTGTGGYMLASACRTLYMAPPGDVGLVALRVETPFVRGMFDKIGVQPQFGQRKEFKNAANTYISSDYTPAHLEATTALLKSLNAELVGAIATGRQLSESAVQQLIDAGPYTGPEAKQHKLVDDLLYRDQVRAEIEKKTGEEDPFVTVAQYIQSGRPHSSGGKTIALVYATGGVSRGHSGDGPLQGESMGSDTVTKALRDAREDDDIAAVVLRVDSPGGSYVASDLIRREVELTKAKKPVVISQGNYAASGGYFISMDGSKILADSATITGSIGVFSGKMVTKDFWEQKIGVHWGPISLGPSGDFYSTQALYDAHGTERMNAMLDRIYSDFVGKAAAGRQLSFDQLESLAHGRVWTGRDALPRKLVDKIGGLSAAIAEARELAGIEADDRYTVKVLRDEPTFFDQLAGRGASLIAGMSPQATRLIQQLATLTTPTRGAELRDPYLPEVH